MSTLKAPKYVRKVAILPHRCTNCDFRIRIGRAFYAQMHRFSPVYCLICWFGK